MYRCGWARRTHSRKVSDRTVPFPYHIKRHRRNNSCITSTSIVVSGGSSPASQGPADCACRSSSQSEVNVHICKKAAAPDQSSYTAVHRSRKPSAGIHATHIIVRDGHLLPVHQGLHSSCPWRCTNCAQQDGVAFSWREVRHLPKTPTPLVWIFSSTY